MKNKSEARLTNTRKIVEPFMFRLDFQSSINILNSKWRLKFVCMLIVLCSNFILAPRMILFGTHKLRHSSAALRSFVEIYFVYIFHSSPLKSSENEAIYSCLASRDSSLSENLYVHENKAIDLFHACGKQLKFAHLGESNEEFWDYRGRE
jgi:hypothetical protein